MADCCFLLSTAFLFAGMLACATRFDTLRAFMASFCHFGFRVSTFVFLANASDLKADYILANPPYNMSDWGETGSATIPGGNTARRPSTTPTSPGCNTASTTLPRPAGLMFQPVA